MLCLDLCDMLFFGLSDMLLFPSSPSWDEIPRRAAESVKPPSIVFKPAWYPVRRSDAENSGVLDGLSGSGEADKRVERGVEERDEEDCDDKIAMTVGLQVYRCDITHNDPLFRRNI
jgi:hypothetical protein